MSYQYLQVQTIGSGNSDLKIENNATTGPHNLAIFNGTGGETGIGNSVSSIQFGVPGKTTDVVVSIATVTGSAGQVLTAVGDGSVNWQNGSGGSGIAIDNDTADASHTVLFHDQTMNTTTVNSNANMVYNPSSSVLSLSGGTGGTLQAAFLSSLANLSISAASSLSIANSAGTGTSGQVLTAAGDGTCSWQNGGGGGSSPYGPPSICFVSSSVGNDSNDGTLNSPVKTLNQALTLCAANIPNPGCTIYDFTASTYLETVQLFGNVTLYCPFAQIDSPGGSTIQTVGARAGNSVTFTYIQNSSGSGFPIENLTGYLTINAVTIFPGNGAPLYNGSGNIMVLNCSQGTFAGIQNVGGGSRTACLIGINSGGSFDANCFSYYSNSLPNIT